MFIFIVRDILEVILFRDLGQAPELPEFPLAQLEQDSRLVNLPNHVVGPFADGKQDPLIHTHHQGE